MNQFLPIIMGFVLAATSAYGQPCTSSAEHCSDEQKDEAPTTVKSVLNAPLAVCSTDPMTGWFRDGRCRTDDRDRGRHLVCAQMTKAFLEFTKSRGNDLSTPNPRFRFPGLKPGDRWCLCAVRWKEAFDAQKAPLVVLNATHASTLKYVERRHLTALQHDIDSQSQRGLAPAPSKK